MIRTAVQVHSTRWDRKMHVNWCGVKIVERLDPYAETDGLIRQ